MTPDQLEALRARTLGDRILVFIRFPHIAGWFIGEGNLRFAEARILAVREL